MEMEGIRRPRVGGSGRKRIPMKKIENKKSLMVAFSKRRKGLFKKAEELSILCGVDVAVVAFSPAGKPFVFSTKSPATTGPTIDQYFSDLFSSSSSSSSSSVQGNGDDGPPLKPSSSDSSPPSPSPPSCSATTDPMMNLEDCLFEEEMGLEIEELLGLEKRLEEQQKLWESVICVP